MIYIVFNINGDVIGVADSKERAVEIHQERYGESDWDLTRVAVGAPPFKDEYSFLKFVRKIRELELNKFYYQ